MGVSHFSTNGFFSFSNIEMLNTEILEAINLVVYVRLPSEYRPLHWNFPNIPVKKENALFLLPIESRKKKKKKASSLSKLIFGDVSHKVVLGLLGSELLRVLLKPHILNPTPNL